MAATLPTQTIISAAIGLLNSLIGELELWQGPSKTAFEQNLNRLVADLEAADKFITFAVMAETTVETLAEVAAL
jgi:hypothetical protein